MGTSQTLVLGLIAGSTIGLGLPVGRLRSPALTLRALLNGVAVGVLLFLVWDVLSAAWEPIDAALSSVHDGGDGLGTAVGYGVLASAGLAAGLLGLVGYERWMASLVARAGRAPAGGVGAGPGTWAVAAASRGGLGAQLATWSTARRLALLIAAGIGLHNFAEGLAIGQSAASGQIALATLLVVGFALHNATEGFGIVAPLAADTGNGGVERPSWRFLIALGLIGGGPTFIGTIAGHAYTSEPVVVAVLTLAAGSIIYVITQLIGVAAKTRRSDLLACGLLIGLLAGFATDAVVTAAGI
jgi:zinc transporter, ZIP family